MGKISPVSAKYIVSSTIEIEGVVDRPDIIGAVFGQTEGLLGADLELRELQRSGRIGRIEVESETKQGKTTGTITIPSSLDKAETSIVAAALEVIQRIGPCNAKIKVVKMEDVRISKRKFVIERAKELLKDLMDNAMPDSQELADEVACSVRVMEIQEYGRERLPAGPAIDESDEIIVVEGRADVINLLKHGIKNAIAINGTSVPATIGELSKEKTVVVFVDGDRGGDLNIKELLQVAEIDFVTKAPDGKEVEELTKKEIHKALRSKIAAEQAKLDISNAKPTPRPSVGSRDTRRPVLQRTNSRFQKPVPQRTTSSSSSAAARPYQARTARVSADEKKAFKQMLEDLVGTRGAYILDNKLNILGKVPVSELPTTVKSLSSGIYAIILDGITSKEIVEVAEKVRVKFVVAMETKVPKTSARVGIVTSEDLE